MTKVGAFSCLAKGLKALRPNLSTSIAFTMFLSALGAVPTLINRLQGHEYSTPPISLLGFLMSLMFWTTQTLILVGVSQVVWGYLKKDSHERVHLFPIKTVRPQILYWSILFTVMIFAIHMGGSWLVMQSASKAVRFVPLPIAPFVFYFPAFIPLMMVDQQISMSKATKQVLSSLKVNFVSLLKLALIAEAVFLVFAISDVFLERLIRGAFSIPESVVIGQVIGVFVDVPIWVINSAMMAVAYSELHGLSAVDHQATTPSLPSISK